MTRNELQLRDIAKVEITKIKTVAHNTYNWSQRRIIITGTDGSKFTIDLTSPLLEKDMKKFSKSNLVIR